MKRKIWPVERKLIKRGFTWELYRRAQKFFMDRSYTFSYDGRGRYRGTFHLSGGASRGKKGMVWGAICSDDPARFMDRPTGAILELEEKLGVL